ncbi:MAG TPA: hypothetical protein VKD90_06440 [Gemmataceae bacterium]|nr:hypothetical protein [Gemmataceae bacterium]
MPLRITGPSRPAQWLGVALLAVLAGCKPAPEVTKYTAPKDPFDTDLISDEPGEGEPRVRVLGAIAPAAKPGEENWYFFKVLGKPKAVERHAAAFDEFVRSLKFQENGPPVWTVPAGWREVGTQGRERIATFRMKKSETVLELTVTQFGGNLLDNINRWRVDQAGAEPITEAEIETKCRVLTVDGRRVVVVDASGPGGKGGMKGPFAK